MKNYDEILAFEKMLEEKGITCYIEYRVIDKNGLRKVGEMYTIHIDDWINAVLMYMAKYECDIYVYIDGDIFEVFTYEQYGKASKIIYGCLQ